MTENLYQRTRRLLEARAQHTSLTVIARKAGLKPAWLSAFNRGDIPDPGVNKVQCLHDYLAKPEGDAHV